MERHFQISPGVTTIKKDLKASITLERPYEGSPTDPTSDHEGAHLVILVAKRRWAKKASRIPGRGYLGYVEGDVDTESAMAADAMGFSGTGHDKRLAAILGDPDSAAKNARKTINNNFEEWRALSRAIYVEREISGSYAEDVFERAQNPIAKIEVESSSGQRWNFMAKVRKVDGHLVTIGIEEENKKIEAEDKQEPENVFDIRTKRPLSEKVHTKLKISLAA